MPNLRQDELNRRLDEVIRNEGATLRRVSLAYLDARRDIVDHLTSRWTGTDGMTAQQAVSRFRSLSMMKQIDDRLKELEVQLGTTLRGAISSETEAGVEAIRRQLELLPSDIRPDLTSLFDKIPTKMIERFVPVVMSDVHIGTSSMMDLIEREMQSGLIQGRGFDNLVREIFTQTPTGEGTPVWRNGEVSVERVVRRAVITVGNAAHQDAIYSLSKSEPLIQKQAIAVIGPNTTDCCLRVHGQIRNSDEMYDLDGTPKFASQMMFPSFHWNCRTQSSMYHPAFEEAAPTSEMTKQADEEAKKRGVAYSIPTRSTPSKRDESGDSWGRTRVDTSDLPLARGAAWNDLNDEDTREFLLRRAKKGGNIDEMIDPVSLNRLHDLANDPSMRTTKESTVFFGLGGDEFKDKPTGEIFKALGTRSTATEVERAKSYAGSSGGVFEVVLPKGTLAIPSKVMGVEETVLLPGSAFEVLSTSDGVTKVRLISDGVEYVNDLHGFSEKIETIAGRHKPEEIVVETPKIPALDFAETAHTDAPLKWVKETFKDWDSGLSELERSAFSKYQSEVYTEWNETLRKNKKFSAVDQKKVQRVDEGIARNPLPQDLVVYRGMNHASIIKDFDHLAGTIVQDKAFVSTTLDPDVAERFAKGGKASQEVIWKITLPKGTPVAPMDMIYSGIGESEILLGRDSKIQITKTSKINGKRLIEAEYVPGSQEQTTATPVEKKPKKEEKPTGPVTFKPATEKKFWEDQMAKGQEWKDSLTPPEYFGLQAYQSTAYISMNRSLRSGETGEWSDAANNVQAVLRKAPKINESIIVYRGFRSTEVYGNAESMIGTVMTDKAFVSTTTNKKIVANFMALNPNKEPSDVMMEIVLPSGTRAAPMSVMKDKKESELLLQRDAEFKVVGVRTEMVKDKWSPAMIPVKVLMVEYQVPEELP
jgi:hypothetical protein